MTTKKKPDEQGRIVDLHFRNGKSRTCAACGIALTDAAGNNVPRTTDKEAFLKPISGYKPCRLPRTPIRSKDSNNDPF